MRRRHHVSLRARHFHPRSDDDPSSCSSLLAPPRSSSASRAASAAAAAHPFPISPSLPERVMRRPIMRRTPWPRRVNRLLRRDPMDSRRPGRRRHTRRLRGLQRRVRILALRKHTRQRQPAVGARAVRVRRQVRACAHVRARASGRQRSSRRQKSNRCDRSAAATSTERASGCTWRQSPRRVPSPRAAALAKLPLSPRVCSLRMWCQS